MDQVQGKHFSITDPQNVNTVIYQINKTEGLMEENTPKFTLERLKCREELVGLNKRKTFFVDAPKDEGNQLIILSFGQDRVVVNMGLLNKDEVKISKRPVPVKFNTLYSEQETEYKDVRYTPNFQRPITIIDPETTEEVKPVVYFDKDTNEVRGKCKLKPQWDITLHQSEWPSFINPQITSAGGAVEKKEPSCTVGGNVNWYSHYGEQYGGTLESHT